MHQNVVYKSSATLVLVRDTLLQLLKSSGLSRRQNFEWFFGETFSFRFLSSLLVACLTFIPPFLLLLGISFFKALLQVEKFSRTPEEREFLYKEVQMGCEEDFYWNVLVKVTWFFSYFSLVCLTESRSTGYGLKDLGPLPQVTSQSCPWALKFADTEVVLRASWLLKLPELYPSTYVC